MTNCVALGVSDRAAAERFYTEVMGFQPGQRSEDWTEVVAGPIRLFLCDDDMTHCMAVDVDDPTAAAAEMESHGATRLFESGGEVFVKDPFGNNWCLSPKE